MDDCCTKRVGCLPYRRLQLIGMALPSLTALCIPAMMYIAVGFILGF